MIESNVPTWDWSLEALFKLYRSVVGSSKYLRKEDLTMNISIVHDRARNLIEIDVVGYSDVPPVVLVLGDEAKIMRILCLVDDREGEDYSWREIQKDTYVRVQNEIDKLGDILNPSKKVSWDKYFRSNKDKTTKTKPIIMGGKIKLLEGVTG
jgi:aminoglycoside phosphotransferase (APT) family kinase protein